MESFKLYRKSNALQNNHFSADYIGATRITLDRVPSTNDFLRGELSNSTPFVEGTVIMAEEQFAGKGQMGKSWESPKGKNLIFSLLLCPSFLPPTQQFDLSIIISLALQQALSSILPVEVKIKWPNDIYVNNNKIAGILIENILQGNKWKHAIVGIGVNVNQTKFSSALKNPTSVQKILHSSYYKEDLLSEICIFIEKFYEQLKKSEQESLRALYLKNLFGLNTLRKYRINGVSVEAKIVDVDTYGRLVLDTNGVISINNFNDVEFCI